MNKYGKLVGFLLLGGVVLALLGAQVTIPYKAGISPSAIVKTYANSQVDTVTWVREPGVAGAAFAAHFKDSVSVSYIAVTRGVDGVYQLPGTTVAKDSIVEFRNYQQRTNTANPDSVQLGTLQLTPLCDSYRFIVTYAASGNGTSKPTVVYEIIKQYYTKP